MSDNKTVSVSIKAPSALTLLFFVFLVLKLTGHIDWGWAWVTLPLWGGLAIVLGGVLLFVLVGLVARITIKLAVGVAAVVQFISDKMRYRRTPKV